VSTETARERVSIVAMSSHAQPANPRPRWLQGALPIAVAAMVASTGLERVDLLAGRGPFTLTPAVLMSTVMVGLALTGLTTRTMRLRITPFLGVAACLVFVAFASVILNGASVTGLGRAGLFTLSVVGASIAVAIAAATSNMRALRFGAGVALLLYAAFALAQLVLWIALPLSALADLHFGIVDLTVKQLGSELPRITGSTVDANRSCLTLSMIATLLLGPLPGQRPLDKPREALIVTVLGVFALATLSRSGIVLFVIVLAGVWALPRLSRLSRRTVVLAVCSAVVLAAIALLTVAWLAPDFIDYIVRTRLTVRPGDSASVHFALIEHAVGLVLSDPTILLTGIGFGTAYTVLGGFGAIAHAGDHANFHSAYLTALVEMGALGLIALAILLFRPIATRWWAISVGLAWFGVFYQSLNDSSQWLLLALAWTMLGNSAQAEERSFITLAATSPLRQRFRDL